MEENIVAKLTAKDDKYACALADQIVAESRETDIWYDYFDAWQNRSIFQGYCHVYVGLIYQNTRTVCAR